MAGTVIGVRECGDALDRIRREYTDWPTLNLTFPQACRLWQLEPEECRCVLEQLIAEGFLTRSRGGRFISALRPEVIEETFAAAEFELQSAM